MRKSKFSLNDVAKATGLEFGFDKRTLSKTLDEVDSLKDQMRGYLEDASKAKSDRDYYKRELERLKTESKFKDDQINLFAKANKDE